MINHTQARDTLDRSSTSPRRTTKRIIATILMAGSLVWVAACFSTEPPPAADAGTLPVDDFVFPEVSGEQCGEAQVVPGQAAALVDNQPRPFGLLADGNNLYWLNRPHDDALGNEIAGNLMKYSFASGNTTELAAGLTDARFLNQDDSSLYWTDADATVKRISKNGGPVDVVLAGSRAAALTVAGGYAVWFDDGSKTVKSADTSSFQVRTLGSAGPGPDRLPSLSIAHGRAIWTTQTDENKGTLTSAPVDASASPATRVLDMWHDSDTRSLQVEGNYAYWIVDTLGDDDFIKRMDLNSGTVVNVVALAWPTTGLRIENFAVTPRGLIVATSSLTETALRLYAKSPSVDFVDIADGLPAANLVGIAANCDAVFVTGHATTGDTTAKSVYRIALVSGP